MNRQMTVSQTFKGQFRLRRLSHYGVYALVSLVLISLPFFGSAYLNDIITKFLIYAIFALSLNLLTGYTGLFSMGHAAFFGVGAYSAAILMVKFGIGSFWVLMTAGIINATLFAAVFGIISLRVTGVYFILVTLAIGQLLYSVAVKWRALAGGYNGIGGISYPDIGLPRFTMTTTSYYYLVLIVFIVCYFFMYRVAISPFGRAQQGIRGDERRMRSLGYNTWLHKYITFVVGGMFAGVAGVLLAFQSGVVVPDHLGIITSVAVAIMVILGGDRVFWGPVLGAAMIVLLEHFISIYAPERWPLILGSLFVASVMFLRGGVALHLVKLQGKVQNRYGSS